MLPSKDRATAASSSATEDKYGSGHGYKTQEMPTCSTSDTHRTDAGSGASSQESAASSGKSVRRSQRDCRARDVLDL